MSHLSVTLTFTPAPKFTPNFMVPLPWETEPPGGMKLLNWAPPATAPAVVDRLASHARRVVFLSSPHRTPHPFFQQPNPMALVHADVERLIAASGLESTIIRPGMFASNALSWWATAIRTNGVVRWPYGAAETAPVDDRDVAAVAARALHQSARIMKAQSTPTCPDQHSSVTPSSTFRAIAVIFGSMPHNRSGM